VCHTVTVAWKVTQKEKRGADMLKNWNPQEMPEKAEIDERIGKARTRLYELQMQIKQHKLPVLVLFEGWGASGKGSTIGKVIKNIDPRFFKVATMASPDENDLRRPFLYRYMKEIPEAGKFTFLDGGWMEETVREYLNEELDETAYAARIESIKRFERQLTDNGYVLLKFFMQIDQKEQTQRIEKLKKDKDTEWRVSEYDSWQNAHYKKCKKVFSRYLSETNMSTAPWYIIDAADRKWAQLQVLETMISGIEVGMQNSSRSVPILQNTFPLVKMPKLKEISLEGCTIEEEEYKEELKKLQKHLGDLHNQLYRLRIPVIITYEGWDAAGKGGNIKRITEALDPRGFEVHPIASPEPHEKARHYLWRFWTRLPKDGHIAIFDRTWYGRVMVERLEGFCSENDWKRAYNEMNEFEKELSDWGAVIVKFWVQIDKDTQLARFTDRQNNPEKRWKITDEDWRNREKWDLYEEAVDEMLKKTSTTYASWHILESVDKKYARIKALHIVIDEIEKAIKERS
jgi:polyphosphate:AMP phosphotransferase